MDNLVERFCISEEKNILIFKALWIVKCIKAKNVVSMSWVVCQFDDSSFSRRELKSFRLENWNHIRYLKNEHKKLMFHWWQNFGMQINRDWNFLNLRNMIWKYKAIFDRKIFLKNYHIATRKSLSYIEEWYKGVSVSNEYGKVVRFNLF